MHAGNSYQEEQQHKHDEQQQSAAASASHQQSAAASTSVQPIPTLEEFAALTRRKVLMGTAGWSDATLLRCGRFYPSWVKSNTQRLKHYATHFPCVEVDTSNYAIPTPDSIQAWIQQVPATFKFHFKAFGMLTMLNMAIGAIPTSCREFLTEMDLKAGANNPTHSVSLSKQSDIFIHALWQRWNNAMRPVYESDKLGVIVFQFQLNFGPTEKSKEHVRWCRSHLAPQYKMAIEFRNRGWIKDETTIKDTVEFASKE